MIVLYKFILVNSYLLLFLAATLKARNLPEDVTSSELPELTTLPTSPENEVSPSSTESAVVLPGESKQNPTGLPEQNPLQKLGNQNVDEIKSGANNLLDNNLRGKKDNNLQGRDIQPNVNEEEDSLEARNLPWRNDAENNNTAHLITEYMKRITAIRKFIRIYEEIIKKIDKSLEGVARKLASGLGDLTNFMRNIRGSEEPSAGNQQFF